MIYEFRNPMPVETPVGYGMLVYVRDGGVFSNKVFAKCWECCEMKMCFEHIVCCTGTRFHTCPNCREIINKRK